MVLEDPLWQDGTTYPARLHRQWTEDVFDVEGVIKPSTGALLVAPRAAGANMSVDVAAGRAVIKGDDEANQGSYRVISTATENLPIGARPGSDSRIDLVVARVRDAAVTGGVSSDWILEVIPGTVAAAPVPPAVPATAIPLAEITVTSATLSITATEITKDRRSAAQNTAYVPTGAVKANVMTFESTASLTPADLATILTKSIVVPPSGLVRIDLQAWMRCSAGEQAYLAPALSGAVVQAANIDQAAVWEMGTSEYLTLSTTVLTDPLTPGQTLIVTAKHWITAGTAWYGRRRLTLTPQ
jgi:hypothetical protein